MKIKIFIVGVVSLLIAMPAVAQETIPTYQYWSINVNGGFSGYLPSGHSFLKDLGPSFGLGVEWTANPLWGLSLDYQYFGFYNNKDYGHTNEFTLSGQFNISNMVAKYRHGSWQKFNTYGHIGVGGAISLDPNKSNEVCGVMPIGIRFEYNVSPLLALNMNFEGRWHTNRFRDVAFNPNGVAIFGITAGIRIKLGTRNHIRNVCSLCDYEAAFIKPSADDEALKRLQCLLDDTCDEVAKSKSAVEDANRQIDALKREIDNLKTREETPAPKPEPVTVNYSKTITFDFAMAVLNHCFYPYLDEVATEMISTKAHVMVVGHADAIGDSSSKMRLSLNRANAVVSYLAGKGVDRRQLTAKGMSDTQPIGDNKTEEGRQQNRRVEFVIQ
ncbi:MAG: OmpA family protein [Bacteroidales bacterium]|nr:OmpA family protein [Bacteroidales bacterium]